MSPSPDSALLSMILGKPLHILSLRDDIVDHISTRDIIIRHLPRSRHCSEEHRNMHGKIVIPVLLGLKWPQSPKALLSLFCRWYAWTPRRSQVWFFLRDAWEVDVRGERGSLTPFFWCTLWCCPYFHLLPLQWAPGAMVSMKEKKLFWGPLADTTISMMGFCVTCLKKPKIVI